MTTDPILPAAQDTDSSAEALFHAAVAHQQAKRFHEAVAAYHRLLELYPECVEAYDNLGVIFRATGDLPRSIAYHRYALTLEPRHAPGFSNLGSALLAAGEPAEAEQAFRYAISLDPGDPLYRYNLGILLHREGRVAEAVPALEAAVACDPGFAVGHCALGSALAELRRVEGAIHHFDRALALRPGYPKAHWGRALARLLAGDYEGGWEDFEWRWKEPTTGCRPRGFAQPSWRGEPLEGRRILLHAEQGFGDALQMVRYAPLLKERGARVIVECRPALARLFAACAGVDEVAVLGKPLPPFDLYLPMMSLPRLLGTRPHDVPPPGACLHPPLGGAPAWVAKLRRLPGFRIGLVWSGSPTNERGRHRSLPVDALRPLLRQPGLTFVSLQAGEAEAALDSVTEGERVVRLGAALRDFADTACAVRELELVVTVDTSVAHLSASLGAPTWVLLSHNACWRWGLEGATTPWYPSARLFRQPAPGDWEAVVEQVAREIAGPRHAAA